MLVLSKWNRYVKLKRLYEYKWNIRTSYTIVFLSLCCIFSLLVTKNKLQFYYLRMCALGKILLTNTIDSLVRPNVYLLPLTKMQQVSKWRVFWVLEGQECQCALQFTQNVWILLAALRQVGLGVLERSLHVSSTDQLYQVLLLWMETERKQNFLAVIPLFIPNTMLIWLSVIYTTGLKLNRLHTLTFSCFSEQSKRRWRNYAQRKMVNNNLSQLLKIILDTYK